MASLAACSTGNGAFSRAWKSTEIRGEGADTLGRPYIAFHWGVQRAVGKGQPGRLESRPQARKPAPQRTRHGGHRKNKPQRGRAATKQVWRHKKSSRAEKNLRASSTEDTEKSKPRRARKKANHREHGGHAKKQTTENTENTEMEKRGRRVEVERAAARAGWRWDSRTARDCVALPA